MSPSVAAGRGRIRRRAGEHAETRIKEISVGTVKIHTCERGMRLNQLLRHCSEGDDFLLGTGLTSPNSHVVERARNSCRHDR